MWTDAALAIMLELSRIRLPSRPNQPPRSELDARQSRPDSLPIASAVETFPRATLRPTAQSEGDGERPVTFVAALAASPASARGCGSSLISPGSAGTSPHRDAVIPRRP